jgi:hypothetical protein
MDPVKWVLILALRMGAVDSKSIEDLVATTRQRRDKTVVWSEPTLPIFPAFRPNGVGVIRDKYATTDQILGTVRLGCELCGILIPVVAHDIRRGTARDVAYMDAPSKVKTTAAAAALGHTNVAKFKGVTADYIGPAKQDVWSDRLAHPAPNDDFAIDMIDASFKRRKRVKHEEILNMYEKNGLDYNVRKDRDRASRMIRDEDKDQFLRKHRLVDRGELSGQDSIKDLGSSTFAVLQR